MEVTELKALFQEELKTFKEALPKFVDQAGLDKAFKDFNTEMATKFETIDTVKTDLASLQKSVELQGVALGKMSKSGGEAKSDFREKLEGAIKAFNKDDMNAKQFFPTTQKSVLSSNFSNNTNAYRPSGVGEIKRGMPYMRDLFTIVNIGSDSHDTISWYEQASILNSAANAAEVRNAAGMTQSNITWTQKNLNSKRIHDFIKVGRDRLKDVSFVEGEVMRLINRNMRLKENAQLLNGLGTGNEIAGINSYATAFNGTPYVDAVQDAQLIDLLGYIKTQIDTDTLGAAVPDTWIANRADVDPIRYKKDTQNRYMYENWALGTSDVTIGGMRGIENPLHTTNTLLAGDLSLATLYVWDDLVVEMYYEGTDYRDGLVTIGAYMRENLRVQDVDKKGIVKVADIAITLADMKKP